MYNLSLVSVPTFSSSSSGVSSPFPIKSSPDDPSAKLSIDTLFITGLT